MGATSPKGTSLPQRSVPHRPTNFRPRLFCLPEGKKGLRLMSNHQRKTKKGFRWRSFLFRKGSLALRKRPAGRRRSSFLLRKRGFLFPNGFFAFGKRFSGSAKPFSFCLSPVVMTGCKHPPQYAGVRDTGKVVMWEGNFLSCCCIQTQCSTDSIPFVRADATQMERGRPEARWRSPWVARRTFLHCRPPPRLCSHGRLGYLVSMHAALTNVGA